MDTTDFDSVLFHDIEKEQEMKALIAELWHRLTRNERLNFADRIRIRQRIDALSIDTEAQRSINSPYYGVANPTSVARRVKGNCDETMQIE